MGIRAGIGTVVAKDAALLYREKEGMKEMYLECFAVKYGSKGSGNMAVVIACNRATCLFGLCLICAR